MTDEAPFVDAVDDPPTSPQLPKYPDTPVGMLQEQYDDLQSEIASTRAMSDLYLARASAAEVRAGQVRAAIAALSLQDTPA
jgi:hypothetical protein